MDCWGTATRGRDSGHLDAQAVVRAAASVQETVQNNQGDIEELAKYGNTKSPQQLWRQEMEAYHKEPDKTIRGSLPYKLEKELLMVLVAPEILSELKALAKQRKQSLDELVEKIIEVYLAGQHQTGRGLTENLGFALPVRSGSL